MKKVERENIDRFREKAASWDESPMRVALSEAIFSSLVAHLPLAKEDGSFHGDNKGVCHFGFDRAKIAEIVEDAGFRIQTVQTVHTITKTVPQNETRDYPVFLLVAQK
ncbi:MAG: hypothetical protein GY762_15600 [Proteobacteria bacterium]|nr:hypothetical protein [Pseudomonadota bacterium]